MMTKQEQMNTIKNCIMDYYNADEKLIQTKSRKSEIIKVRHMIVYMMRYEMGLTFREIGEMLNKEVSTITRNFQVIQDSVQSDRNLCSDLKEIKFKIREKYEEL